jgi:anti-sigma factor RsiW
MRNPPTCQTIDPLVTPYIDRQLTDAERHDVDEHLRVCPPCYSRVVAERAVRDLLAAHKPALKRSCAPAALHSKCAAYARMVGTSRFSALPRARSAASGLRPAPLALAASLVLLVGGAFFYQLTQSSSRAMAAELAADHLKCFALNDVLRTHDSAAAVESSMLSSFGWHVRLPDPARTGLDLIGARPCLYGEGKVAHIMYRHHGEPVSLYMLPASARKNEVVQVLGHEAAIWCVGNRTFVLMAREARPEMDRLASLMQADLK